VQQWEVKTCKVAGLSHTKSGALYSMRVAKELLGNHNSYWV
jgi:hypothetical protein